MAHEIIGHYEAWKKGTTQNIILYEEVQASIRASKFGIGLSNREREILYEDAMDRLKKADVSFDKIKGQLDIWER